MDKLTEIMNFKRKEVQKIIPQLDMLKAAAFQRNDFGGFRAALDRGADQLGVIAEVKKASPSAGVIDPNFDPVKQAKMYINGGASCMSILTDEPYFQGHLSYLTEISRFSPIPLLRKDFTVHEAQIYEAVVAGADAIVAMSVQLDVLVEVHNYAEMERAIDLGADLIGVNNRNLKTFTTDLATTEKLADEVPDNVILVSESGLKNPMADGQRVLNAGANAVLVGESLMRENDPSQAIGEYLSLTANLEVEMGESEAKV